MGFAMCALIDNGLLESIFCTSLEKMFGKASVIQTRKRLYEKYGISLHQAVNRDFSKLEDVIAENFAGALHQIKSDMLSSIVALQQKNKSEDATIVDDCNKVRMLARIINNPESMMLFFEISEIPLTAKQLVETTSLSQTSVYRKISEMKDAGLLEQKGFEITDQKRIPRYETCFENVKLVASGKSLTVHMISKK
jgi:DNA-binding transcriptional ArsR family regulator